MPSEDRIRDLCQRVIAEPNEGTVRLLLADLQSALKEFIGSTRSRATGTLAQIQALEAKNKSKITSLPTSENKHVA